MCRQEGVGEVTFNITFLSSALNICKHSNEHNIQCILSGLKCQSYFKPFNEFNTQFGMRLVDYFCVLYYGVYREKFCNKAFAPLNYRTISFYSSRPKS